MQERIFELLVAKWPSAFVFFGGDGKVGVANERWVEMSRNLGVPEGIAQAVGRHISELAQWQSLIPAEIFSKLPDVMSGVIDEIRSDCSVFIGGRQRWHVVRAVSLDGDGAIILHVDITQRKLAELAIHEVATRDALTGLLNRSAILDRMEKLLDEVERPPWTIAIADINDLKSINDSAGHLEGDWAIRMVAEALRQPSAEVGRIGGDEFLVLLANTSPVRADDYRAAVDLSLASAVQGKDYSVALGMAYVPLDGTSMIDLLSSADRNMYRTKRAQMPRGEQGKSVIDIAASLQERRGA